MENVREIIEAAWDNRELLKEQKHITRHQLCYREVDKGRLRTAEPAGDDWKVNEWVKKAVVLYFPIRKMETIEVGPFEFHDKMALKSNYKELGVGLYLTLWLDMVLTFQAECDYDAFIRKHWSLCRRRYYGGHMGYCGSCAQIGKNVHLSGGVGIGGVLEPLQASPVIIEDNAFVGSRCIVVEGVRVGKEAVLGANVVSDKINEDY